MKLEPNGCAEGAPEWSTKQNKKNMFCYSWSSSWPRKLVQGRGTNNKIFLDSLASPFSLRLTILLLYKRCRWKVSLTSSKFWVGHAFVYLGIPSISLNFWINILRGGVSVRRENIYRKKWIYKTFCDYKLMNVLRNCRFCRPSKLVKSLLARLCGIEYIGRNLQSNELQQRKWMVKNIIT